MESNIKSTYMVIVDPDERITNLYKQQLQEFNNTFSATTQRDIDRITSDHLVRVALVDGHASPAKRAAILSKISALYPDIYTVGILKSKDSPRMVSGVRNGIRDFLFEPLCCKKLEKALCRAAKNKYNGQSYNELFPAIVHDLKNKLIQVLTLTEMLYEDNKQTEQQQDLTRIIDLLYLQGQETKLYLEDMLAWTNDFSLLNKFRKETIHLDPFVTAVAKEMEVFAREKKIHIKTDVSHTMPVQADRFMLQFILRNLIHNAIKFSHPHNIVDVSSYTYEDRIYLIVSDSGEGMDDATRVALMQGKQPGNDKTPKKSGCGIGLKIVCNFLRKHNSALSIVSEPGYGSCFFFELQPAVEDPIINSNEPTIT